MVTFCDSGILKVGLNLLYWTELNGSKRVDAYLQEAIGVNKLAGVKFSGNTVSLPCFKIRLIDNIYSKFIQATI